jgi:hypothetical protein
MKINKVLIAAALLLLAWPVGYGVYILGYSVIFSMLDFCGVEEVERLKSQDGRFEAMVYIHDCGATTSSTWRVALASADDPDEFVDVFGGDVRGPMQVLWKAPAVLSVKAGAAYRRDDSEIYKRLEEWNGVRVLYVNMDRPQTP